MCVVCNLPEILAEVTTFLRPKKLEQTNGVLGQPKLVKAFNKSHFGCLDGLKL